MIATLDGISGDGVLIAEINRLTKKDARGKMVEVVGVAEAWGEWSSIDPRAWDLRDAASSGRNLIFQGLANVDGEFRPVEVPVTISWYEQTPDGFSAEIRLSGASLV